MFDNILSNALKYTPESGTITIETRQERARAADGGARCQSISPTRVRAFQPRFARRIFEKFFRLEHHQTEGQPGARGAGIGLYMCRQIVELHGGEISCATGVDESGTRITVSFPVPRTKHGIGRDRLGVRRSIGRQRLTV